jgi:hypothetical protein
MITTPIRWSKAEAVLSIVITSFLLVSIVLAIITG